MEIWCFLYHRPRLRTSSSVLILCLETLSVRNCCNQYKITILKILDKPHNHSCHSRSLLERPIQDASSRRKNDWADELSWRVYHLYLRCHKHWSLPRSFIWNRPDYELAFHMRFEILHIFRRRRRFLFRSIPQRHGLLLLGQRLNKLSKYLFSPGDREW